MKANLYILIPLFLIALAVKAQALDLKIMSFNVQQPNGTNWDGRKAGAAAIINTENPDVIGTQEAVVYMRDYLIANTSGYTSFGQARDGGDAGEASYIFYKTAKYSLDAANSGNFWLSNTPAVPSRLGGSYNRICTYVRLVEISSGKGFYLFNMHNYMPSEDAYRLSAAKFLSQKVAARAISDPVYITGDFNSSENDAVTVWMKSGTDNTHKCRDTYRDIDPTGAVTTGFGTKFDYIYCPADNKYTSSASRVILTPVASDHHPIVATVKYSASTVKFNLKAETQNLWRRNDSWPSRLNNIVKMVNDQRPDFLAIAEGDEGKAPELASRLTDYTIETGPWKEESTCIIYNHTTLTVVETGAFGYSSTPDVNKASDWGDGAVYNWLRKCNWILFEHKASGERFYVYNNHLDALNSNLGPAYWRRKQVELMTARIAARTHTQYPFLVTGDLNEEESGGAIAYLKSGTANTVQMEDSYRQILPNGDGYTFGTIKLDYIFIQKNSVLKTLDANIVYQSQYGHLSDHNGIWATFTIGEVAVTPAITLSQTETITEGSENGKKIIVSLLNDAFINSINAANFTVTNLPAGVTKGVITRDSPSQVSITLSGNAAIGTYTNNITDIKITIAADQLVSASGIVSAQKGITLTKAAQAFPVPGIIQAEAFSDMAGIQLENTTDIAGGQNIGFLSANDWLTYKINVSKAGKYKLNFRTASLTTNGKLQIKINNTDIKTQDFTLTGGWQTWSTTTSTIDLSAGVQELKFTVLTGDFNINWFEFMADGVVTGSAEALNNTEMTAYPNPVKDILHIKNLPDNSTVQILNILGGLIQEFHAEDIDVSSLQPGIYFAKAKGQVFRFSKYE